MPIIARLENLRNAGGHFVAWSALLRIEMTCFFDLRG